MIVHGIDIPGDRIANFCRKYGILRLSLFGSILRDDFGPESDIDILVEFEPGHTPSLFRMVGMEMELNDILGRKVDLRTPAELSRHFREEVVKEAMVQYVEGKSVERADLVSWTSKKS